MNKLINTLGLWLGLSVSAWAAEITEHIAHTVAGFKIPIIVVQPTSGKGPFPVVYHVHGGGWNGGTVTEVPDATVPSGHRFLTDELGVIHVGLAYRGKVQGTFAEAMDDLRASVAWFEARAAQFNADLSRVGLSGGSAGTPLSALLAQEMPHSRTYVGMFGVYDLLNNADSLFPNEETRADFGLSSEAQQRAASVYHQLRPQPPATLLFHGGHDILTHPTQSIRFATRLQKQGTSAEVIVYPEVNHGYYSERYPVEFKDTLLRIAKLYTEHLGVTKKSLSGLDEKIDNRLAGYFPQERIETAALLGKWVSKQESFEFIDERSGMWSDGRNNMKPFTFRVSAGFLTVDVGEDATILYLQQNGRALYEIPQNDVRRTGQRVHFTK
jgi:acetyl esterase/lipase